MRLAAFIAAGAVVAITLGAALYAYLHSRYTTGISSPTRALGSLALIGAVAGAGAYQLVKHKPVEKQR